MMRLAGALLTLSKGHDAGIAVDGYHLALRDALAADPRAHHGRNAAFPGHDGAVGQHPTDVGDEPPRLGEERRPSWCRGRADEDCARLHLPEVGRASCRARGWL